MPRQRFVWFKGDWVEIDTSRTREKRVHLISDNLDYVKNPATGQRFTSKSKLLSDYKARGYQVMGNDKPGPKPGIAKHPEHVGQALSRKYDELASRR